MADQTIILYPYTDTFVSGYPYLPPVIPTGEEAGFFPFPPGQLEIYNGGPGTSPGPGIPVTIPYGPHPNVMADILAGRVSYPGDPIANKYVAMPASLHISGYRFCSFRVGGFNTGSELSKYPAGAYTEATNARQIRAYQVYSQFGYVNSDPGDLNLSMTSGSWAPAGITFRIDGPTVAAGGPYPLAMPWDVVGTAQVNSTTMAPASLSTSSYRGLKWTAWLTDNQQILNYFAYTGHYFDQTSATAVPNQLGVIPLHFDDIASIQIGFDVGSLSGSTPELDVKKLGLVVWFNDAPSATPAVSDVYDGSYVNSLTPTITWDYIDPEQDRQAAFQVLTFAKRDVDHPKFPVTWTVGQSQPPYMTIIDNRFPALVTAGWPNDTTFFVPRDDSGVIQSSSTTYKIPPGALRNGEEVVTFVFVTDAGSGGRYNWVQSQSTTPTANKGLTYTPSVEPVLMPSLEFKVMNDPLNAWNPALGSIGPVVVKNRVNLLATVDANFTGISGPSVGGWTTYSGTPGTVTAVSEGVLGNALQAVRTTTSASAIKSGATLVNAGDLLTGSILYNLSVHADSALHLGVAFYSDAAGTSVIGVNAGGPDEVAAWSPYAYQSASVAWTKAVVMTRVPPGALSARLVVWVNAATETITLKMTEAGLSLGVANLIDDASFEYSSGFYGFWEPSVDSPSTQSLTTPSSPPASWPFSRISAHLTNAASPATNTIQTTALFDTSNTDYWFSVDHRTSLLSGGGYHVDLPGTGTVTGSSTQAWQTMTAYITLASGQGPVVLSNTVLSGTEEYDNARLEMVLAYVPVSDGTPNNTGIPSVPVMGDVGTGLWGQGWAAGDDSSVYTTAQAVGAGSVSMHNIVTGPSDGSHFLEQFFTVSGYSTLAFDWDWAAVRTANNATAYMDFLDASGVQISRVSIPMNSNTSSVVWAHVNQVVDVPLNAAYCRWWFENPGWTSGNQWIPTDPTSLYICNPAVTLNGSPAPSLPWLDGGWTAGGFSQNSVPGVGLQRSSDGSTWVDVRYPPNAASGYNPTALIDSYSLSFTDYEFPINDYGDAQTLYYRSVGRYPQTADIVQGPYGPQVEVVNPTSFAPSNWLLIDPLVPDSNIILQVKRATFTQDENQTVIMPVGRGRKVVIGDTQIFGDTITLELLTTRNDQYRNLQTQYQKVYPLLLVNPDGEQWYVRLTKRSRERVWQGRYTSPYRTYSITMEQVDVVK